MIQNVFTNAMPALGKQSTQLHIHKKSKIRQSQKRNNKLRYLLNFDIRIFTSNFYLLYLDFCIKNVATDGKFSPANTICEGFFVNFFVYFFRLKCLLILKVFYIPYSLLSPVADRIRNPHSCFEPHPVGLYSNLYSLPFTIQQRQYLGSGHSGSKCSRLTIQSTCILFRDQSSLTLIVLG